MLIQAFALQIQGFTDSWNYSPLFGEWTSIHPEDVRLEPDSGQPRPCTKDAMLSFSNPLTTQVNIQGLLEILTESLETKSPTRFVAVVPKQEILPNLCLEIATLGPFRNCNAWSALSTVL